MSIIPGASSAEEFEDDFEKQQDDGKENDRGVLLHDRLPVSKESPRALEKTPPRVVRM